jgi:hypothetical protein
MKDYEPGVTVPPLHPYCRSTTAPWFDDDFTEVEFRASRDAAGKTAYEVPEDMTYPEWEEQFMGGRKTEFETAANRGIVGVVENSSEQVFSEIDSVALNRVLKKHERKASGLDFEIGEVIDSRGGTLWKGRGDGHSVAPPTDVLKDNVFIHNHPLGKTFSPADIRNTVMSDAWGCIATTDKHEYHFMKMKKDANPELWEDFRRENSYVLANSAVIEDVKKGIIDLNHYKKHAEELTNQRLHDMINSWLASRAEDYGYSYMVKKI